MSPSSSCPSSPCSGTPKTVIAPHPLHNSRLRSASAPARRSSFDAERREDRPRGRSLLNQRAAGGGQRLERLLGWYRGLQLVVVPGSGRLRGFLHLEQVH